MGDTRMRMVVVGGAVVVTGIATWAGLRTGELPQRTAAADTALHVPECGHSWDPSVHVDIIRDIIDVPEFHDCQRLVETDDNGGYRYGALAAVFASSTLAGLADALIASLPVSGAGSDSVTAPGGPLPPVVVQVVSDLVPGAVVYSDAPYDRLGIATGLNCLYFYLRRVGPTSPPTWHARMVNKGTSLTCETLKGLTLVEGKELQVRSTTPVGSYDSPADYPDVARWDWDATHKWQYIGIKCGAAWCEVGQEGFELSQPMVGADKANARFHKVFAIKGWHDRQMLAKLVDDKLVPSGVEGIIWPDPELGAVRDDAYATWVPSAYVVLQAGEEKEALAKYRRYYNFETTSFDHPVEMKVRRRVSGAAPTFQAEMKRHLVWAFKDHEKRDLVFRPVGQEFKDKYKVPAVARWRWLKDDEGSWIRCTEGCCEMSF